MNVHWLFRCQKSHLFQESDAIPDLSNTKAAVQMALLPVVEGPSWSKRKGSEGALHMSTVPYGVMEEGMTFEMTKLLQTLITWSAVKLMTKTKPSTS